VGEALAALGARGLPLGIVTNKMQAITDITLADLDLARHFGTVVGAREGLARKPDAAPVLLACRELGVAATDAVFVGDSGADAGAAKAAGMPFVAVSFGYCRGPVTELGADAIIDHFAELVPTLDRLAARAAA
jgi:phosphoglycolate phosphatase